jgi:hypothetical protein
MAEGEAAQLLADLLATRSSRNTNTATAGGPAIS